MVRTTHYFLFSFRVDKNLKTMNLELAIFTVGGGGGGGGGAEAEAELN